MEYCEEHKRIAEEVRSLKQWKRGNGALGAEDRLRWLEQHAVTNGMFEVSVTNIVRKTVREMNGEGRADWNKWVNTLLLLITSIGVFVGFWGGG